MRKRTIFPFIFNGELTCRIVNSKLARTTVAVLLGITVACGGISGCDNGEDIVTETETEVVEVTDRYNGEGIYFKIGDTFYDGRVVEGVSTDEVLVRLADGSEMTINLDLIRGTLLADQPDVGTYVFLLVMVVRPDSDPDLFWGQFMRATIEAAYSNGMRKIMFHGCFDKNEKWHDLSGISFVHEDTKWQDGGYLTRDQLARRIGGQDGEKW